MHDLLGQRDGGLFAAYADLEARPARIDGEIPIAQPAHEVEGRTRRLLARQAQGIGCHRRLDRRAHLRGAAEVPIRGRKPVERLVRALEVVVLHEQRHAALAVVEVGEHRPRQELLPHRLPEALDLAAGLRVVRATLHVRNPVASQLLLEGGRATPRGVLPPLIGENLARSPMVGNAPRQGFHHERASLVVCHHQAHQVARVIVHECGHIDALVPAQKEREEIRLPQLVRFRALEAHYLRTRPGLRLRGLGLGKPFLLEHPAHRRLRGADAEEAPQHVANAPAASLRLGALDLNDGFAPGIRLGGQRLGKRPLARPQCRLSTFPVALHPVGNGCIGNAQFPGDFLGADPAVYHHRGGRLHDIQRPRRMLPVPVYRALRLLM
jgi:hypothetical protein